MLLLYKLFNTENLVIVLLVQFQIQVEQKDLFLQLKSNSNCLTLDWQSTTKTDTVKVQYDGFYIQMELWKYLIVLLNNGNIEWITELYNCVTKELQNYLTVLLRWLPYTNKHIALLLQINNYKIS